MGVYNAFEAYVECAFEALVLSVPLVSYGTNGHMGRLMSYETNGPTGHLVFYGMNGPTRHLMSYKTNGPMGRLALRKR